MTPNFDIDRWYACHGYAWPTNAGTHDDVAWTWRPDDEAAVGTLRVWWTADRRRRLTLAGVPCPSPTHLARCVVQEALLVPGDQATRAARWLQADPGRGVTVTRSGPLVTVTLDPVTRWTPARVRAADAVTRPALRLTYIPARAGRPADVRVTVAGSDRPVWWGEVSGRTFIVGGAHAS